MHMELWAIVLIGIALSMDAMAVTLSNVLCNPHMPKFKLIFFVFAFAIFQGVMPVIGYVITSLFGEAPTHYAGIITFIVLGGIGIFMIKEALKELKDPKSCEVTDLSYKAILIQAVATSIDAFIVGVSFMSFQAPIGIAAIIIAITTLIACTFAALVGQKVGLMFGSKAKLIGGILLVIIGVMALF